MRSISKHAAEYGCEPIGGGRRRRQARAVQRARREGTGPARTEVRHEMYTRGR